MHIARLHMHVGMVCPVNAIDMLEMLCMLHLTQITPHNLVLGILDSRLLLFTRYTHAHHVPHVKHIESCRLDKMAKRSRDDSASVPLLCSLPTATLCCPPPILFTGQGVK